MQFYSNWRIIPSQDVIDAAFKRPDIIAQFSHGGDDKVTDKDVSRKLHDAAASRDKTLKLYPGMWHGLLYEETSENINIVFAVIINWLNQRTDQAAISWLERELKHQNYESLKDEEQTSI
ncbi:hypothetical protein DITRI_Ditri12bG0081000 [Diplodiscus trichospermus]